MTDGRPATRRRHGTGQGCPGPAPDRGGSGGGRRGALIAFVSTSVVVGRSRSSSTAPTGPRSATSSSTASDFVDVVARRAAGLLGRRADVRLRHRGDPDRRPAAGRRPAASAGPAFFPLRVLAIIFIDVLRGIPLVLLILLLGFGVPALADLAVCPSSAMFWGVTALVLSYGAYTAEIYRSGIESVPESQRASARALGLTQWQALRYAILPQAAPQRRSPPS